MANLKIRVFKGGSTDPASTVTIPKGVLGVASRLIPGEAYRALQDKGIELNEIIRLADNPEASGILVEIEDHAKNERIVISLS